MATDDKDCFIQYFADKVNTHELYKCVTVLTIEEFWFTFDSVSSNIDSLKKEIEKIKAEFREDRTRRKG